MTNPGLDPRSAFSRHVSARFADFTDQRTPWARRLWDVGTFLALEELYGAGVWTDRKVLSQSAVRWLQNDLQRKIGQDIAFGTKELRQELTRCLHSDLTLRSDGRRRIRHVTDVARDGYLIRWAEAVDDGSVTNAERVARSVASHLLDSGHSLIGLKRWLVDHSGLSAVDLVSEAAVLDRRGPQTFRVWVAVHGVSDIDRLAVPLAHFATAAEVPDALMQRFQAPRPSIIGAFTFEAEARDAEKATEIVAATVERMHARARFAGRAGQVRVADEVFVEGEDRFISLTRPDRGAAIMSLVAEGQLLAVSPISSDSVEHHGIDDALELAAALNSGPIAPAISGSWAALEALLTDSQDPDQKEGKVAAAVHSAKLAACSWPRAELTALSYQIDGKRAGGPALIAKLTSAETNRDRSEIVARHLRDKGGLPLKRSWRLPSDAAAVLRMNRLLANRKEVLNDVTTHLEGSLRRLYRCRNVIVHGGSTRGDVLDSTLRVAAPIVGATLDRLTHAHLALRIDPLTLATRADSAIQLASDDMGFDVTDLLDGSRDN